jgi:DNA repair exonuclease SbcCD nuclease subunit
MKFIHAADLHIDSPLKGLRFEEGSSTERLRLATREAFTNLITLAIDEEVDLLVIAGDLFDGAWPDMRTGLWTIDQFRRLREHNIRVYLIRGNHDAASVVAKNLSWPEDIVYEFDHRQPQTVIDERSGAALHGQSFADRQALEDLAANYPAAVPGRVNIGLLHTSLAGDPQHDTYAPTSPEVLATRGYDYWALGHIHHKSIVAREPHIVFAGNTQGRHIRETGPKGCFVVTIEEGDIQCDFRETDVIRWCDLVVTLEPDDGETELYAAADAAFGKALADSGERAVAARLTLRGACQAHDLLAQAQSRAKILAELQNRASDCAGELWLELVHCETQPTVNLDELRQAGDLVGELLRSIDQIRHSDDALLALAHEHLQPLVDKVGEALTVDDVNFTDPAVLRRWLDDAEGLLLSQLLRGEA